MNKTTVVFNGRIDGERAPVETFTVLLKTQVKQGVSLATLKENNWQRNLCYKWSVPLIEE